MSKYQSVADSFRALVGTGAADIQNAYGMQGDWCMMTVWIGFRNADALDNLADGMKTAWVPSLWDWYNNIYIPLWSDSISAATGNILTDA